MVSSILASPMEIPVCLMYAPKTARCSIVLKLGAILLTSASDEKIAAKRIYSEYLGGVVVELFIVIGKRLKQKKMKTKKTSKSTNLEKAPF